MADQSTSFGVGTAANAFVFDDATGTLYIAAGDAILKWSLSSPTLQTIYDQNGPPLGGLALSADGSFLLSGFKNGLGEDGTVLRLQTDDYAFDLITFEQNYDNLNAERDINDVVILADGRALTSSNFAGSGGLVGLRRFDADDAAPAIEVVTGILQSSGIVASEHGRYAFVLGGNYSSGPMMIYDSVTGAVTATNNTYDMGWPNYGNFNHAPPRADLNETRGLAVSYGTGGLLLVMDLNLILVKDLSGAFSSSGIAGLQFSQDGNHLFVWDTVGDDLIVLDTHSWAQVANLNLTTTAGSLSGYDNALDVVAGGDLLVMMGHPSGEAHFQIIDLATRLTLTQSGTASADALYGSVGADTLNGGGGDDVLHGGARGDVLNGAGGTDAASYASAQAGVVADLQTPANNAGEAAGDTFTAIEGLIGSIHNDTLAGNGGDNTLEGGGGNDLLNGRGGVDTAIYDMAAGAATWVHNLDGTWTVTAGAGNVDTLTDVEFLRFKDRLIDLQTAQETPITPSLDLGAFDGGVFTISNVNDFAYDDATGVFYFSTIWGRVYRWSAVEERFLDPIQLANGKPGNLDISPDGAYLFVSDWQTEIIGGELEATIHRVSLDDFSVDELTFRGDWMINEGAFDLVSLADGTTLFTTAFSGSGGIHPLRRFDTDAGVFAPSNVPGFGMGEAGYLVASEHGRYAFIQQPGSTGGELFIYDTFSQSVTASTNSFQLGFGGSEMFNWGRGAINETRGLVANVTGSHLLVLNLGLGLVQDMSSLALTGAVAVQFSESGNHLFVWMSGADEIQVYETFGWSQIDTIAVEGLPYFNFGPIMQVVGDGKLLALHTSTGFEIINLARELAFTSNGSSSGDYLRGAAGNDTLDGGASDDVITGDGGFDTLRGGDGLDLVSYASDAGGAFVHLGWAWARDGWGDEDRLSGFENVLGSPFNDVLIGAAGVNTIYGGAGADWIEDIGDGGDSFHGEAGNDVILGGAGDDFLLGGAGDDALLGGAGNDWLNDEAGYNWIYGGAGADMIFGGDGIDILFGGDGGGAGDLADEIQGGAGNDALIGEAGDDVLDAGAGDDWAYGGDGADDVIGGAGNDVLAGEDGDDAIEGGEGHDFVFGGNGDDTLLGGAGNDWIDGSWGNDVINGGAGADSLIGGVGDRFVYASVEDSPESAADVIGSFWRPSVIDVSAIDADGDAGNGDTAFTFVSAFTNVAGQAVLTYEAGANRSIARFDVDGDGASDLSIVVLGVELTAADFAA